MEAEYAHGEEDAKRLHSVALLLIAITGNFEVPKATLGIQMGLADLALTYRRP